MTAESFHNIPIIFVSSLARCKTQGMVRPHKYCIFHQNPTHADLVGMVDSCLTTSLPWWLPFSYSAFLSQNWELLGQAPLVSIQWSCIVIHLTQNPFTLSTLVDNLWFPPIQFNLLTGCPLGSGTSCKSVQRTLVPCSLCMMLKEWQEKARQSPKRIQWFPHPCWFYLCHSAGNEPPCSLAAFLSLP